MPQGFSPSVNAIAVGASKASAYDGRIADNDIVMNRTNPTSGGAIMVFSVEGTGTVDVVGNVISGTLYNNGIHVRPDFGSVEARVINNQVTGQTDVAGQPGALAASSNVEGVVVSLLNNTLVDNETGVFVLGRLDLGESVSGIVANNVITRSSDVGMRIDPDFEGTVANRNNLVFDNGGDFFVPGPGTIFQDPLFRGPNDFRLTASSPAIDAGDDSSVPPDITMDLAGETRIRDGNGDGTARVDIGAFEAPVPAEEQIADLIEDLEDVIAVGSDTPLADKVEDAVATMQTALDELNKVPPDHQAAVGNIEGAVGDLEAAVEDGLLDFEQGTDLMDQLAGVARQLADDAVAQAIAEGGDPAVIADAQLALDEGDTLRNSGAFKDAVNKYKDALAKAESA